MNTRRTQLLSALLLATAAGAANAQTSPYAGEQQRSIKALSERDIAELQSGHGMGLAKSAELNGYPGPAHVLELAAPLQLTPQQRAATSSLLAEHKATARDMGVRLIAAERALDDVFAHRSVDPETLDRLTLDIGVQQAQLRAEHLRTHLTQTALLTPEQVTRYSQLRGYAAAEPAKGGGAAGHAHKHDAAGHSHGDATTAIGAPGDKAKVTRTVNVDMTDTMRFNPASITARQGETIRFVVKNSGQLKHEFVLGTDKELKEHYELMKKFPEMEHSDPNQVSLAPGKTGEVIWQFTKAGKVDFACLQPGHYDAGMKGVVDVGAVAGPTKKSDGHADHKH